MSQLRIVLPILLLAAWSTSGQSVRSTRSGLLYFFDGYVFIGEEQLQHKFGRFPEIGEGRVLRTELGRAEVLLTPGVLLRVDENSAIRVLSDSLSDTRVEVLHGSVIVEVGHEQANPPDTLIYKDWQVRVPEDSIARIDSEPAQVRILSGTAAVSTANASVVVQRGQELPLASVLLAEKATTPASDSFNLWAMNRSSVVSEDNAIGAGITDDPDQLDDSGVALGGFSYFPQTGVPSLGIAYPYGLSFWSPSQSLFNPYLPGYPYGFLYQTYPRLPAGVLLYPHPIRVSTGTGILGWPSGVNLPRPSVPPLPRIPSTAPPHPAVPRGVRR
jgi:hypothetical protein